MASKFNFSLDLGSDCPVEITYSPGGVDFDLTGWAIRAQHRRSVADDVADLELNTSGGTITQSGAVLLLDYTATLIASMEGQYVYDVLATNGSMKRRVVEGIVTFNPASTR